MHSWYLANAGCRLSYTSPAMKCLVNVRDHFSKFTTWWVTGIIGASTATTCPLLTSNRNILVFRPPINQSGRGLGHALRAYTLYPTDCDLHRNFTRQKAEWNWYVNHTSGMWLASITNVASYSMSNVILVDEKFTLFHQYLRYWHKGGTIVFSILGAILWV